MNIISKMNYDYIWAWGNPDKYPELGKRKGHRCRVLVRGKMNSCLIEFEDGYKVNTSRNGLKRSQDADSNTNLSM